MKRPKTGGRRLGTPNKASAQARQALASFVDGNAHRLSEWLQRVSEGIQVPVLNDHGQPVLEYSVPPDPARAFELFVTVLEFHVPKHSRHQHSGNASDPVVIESNINIFSELVRCLKVERQS